MEKTESSGNSPEKKFSTGAISATVWKNIGKSKKDGQEVEFRTIKLDRRYKDKNDEWQKTDSFALNDIPKIILALQQAYTFMAVKAKDENSE